MKTSFENITFKRYELSVISVNGGLVDNTTLEYSSELKHVEVRKLVKTYLNRIGYGGKRFKFSIKAVN